ncbi:PTS sugar transporter subunit IIA [Lactobacillus acetotolerans]|jgi:PTS system mannose-specific IIA component|uniref:PTS sugar transporter subunit IIA n=1 Tax=Lactobacillus acetotolerans TaxID=1600 RepID=UPI000EDF10A6|nr:PTS sugar transporter subunit IIA [Lactobacillus acetotolerans]HCX39934.1 PTS mannose transporter subunit IID [Lactobacillus acetotolerans]
MVSFVVATHGKLAEGFESALTLIIGKPEKISFLGLYEGNSVDEFGQKIVTEVNRLDEGDGVIIFTDLFGASPFNQAVSKLGQTKAHKCKILTGVNLPMLIEAINSRMMGKNIDQITAESLDASRVGIKDLASAMNN